MHVLVSNNNKKCNFANIIFFKKCSNDVKVVMVQVKHRQRQQQSLQQETGLQHLLLQQRHHQIRKQVSLILQWLQVLLQRPQCSTIHYYHAFREYFLCRRFQQPTSTVYNNVEQHNYNIEQHA